MIKQLEKYINEKDIETIANVILNQYHNYVKTINTPEFNHLFSEEYASHKKQHSISWAIFSAFTIINKIGKLDVNKLVYGRGHSHPILSDDNIEIHILSSQTDFDAQYLQKCYKYNINNFTKKKLFCYIKFTANYNRLLKVELCLPNENGEIVNSEVILSSNVLKLVA